MHFITKIEGISRSKSVLTEWCSPNITLTPSEAKPTRFVLYGMSNVLKKLIIVSKID